MKKDFHDGTYRVLGILLILSFCVTAVDILPLCYAVRTALAAATLGYVSWLRVKKPELAAECPLAYLQYFWTTATAYSAAPGHIRPLPNHQPCGDLEKPGV